VVLDEEAGAALDAQSGGASRFFYCAKASKAEREAGCANLPAKQQDESREEDAPGANNPRNRGGEARRNHHPTVKPVALMEWLARLVTPPGGFVLDPFTGSGTTGVACARLGLGFVGIEREPEYMAIAKARITAVRS
jgi:site-specific DNA-methyltransferase (adenine-specific)